MSRFLRHAVQQYLPSFTVWVTSNSNQRKHLNLHHSFVQYNSVYNICLYYDTQNCFWHRKYSSLVFTKLFLFGLRPLKPPLRPHLKPFQNLQEKICCNSRQRFVVMISLYVFFVRVCGEEGYNNRQKKHMYIFVPLTTDFFLSRAYLFSSILRNAYDLYKTSLFDKIVC